MAPKFPGRASCVAGCSDVGPCARGGRAFLAAVIGASMAVFIWERRPRSLLVGAAGGAAMVLIAGGIAVTTRHPQSLMEPRYSGVLRLAPEAVGNIEDIVNRFSE